MKKNNTKSNTPNKGNKKTAHKISQKEIKADIDKINPDENTLDRG